MATKRRTFVILLAVLILMAVISILPVFLMCIDSLKTGTELSRNSWRLPEVWTVDNYRRLISYNAGILMRTYLNAIFVALIYTMLTLCVSSLAAFAFSKYRFKFRRFLFFMLLATMMIPTEITIPPMYIMFSKIKWLNTYQVQIFPGIANVFCMFMLKQYMDSLPTAVIEMARIDGASHLRTFASIMVPISAPAIGAMAILVFLSKWNDFLWPKIMLTNPAVMPIMIILPTLNDQNNTWAIPWELLMAGCTIVVIPLIIVFFIFQNYFMSSVTLGAVKE